MADVAPMRIHQHREPSSIVRLNDDAYIQTAGLDRSGTSGRKSSVEKLLEQSLNTGDTDTYIGRTYNETNQQVPANGLSDGVGVRVSPHRPQNLKSDEFIQDAGLSRTGRVARKSSMERLLEDQLNTRELQTSSPIEEGRTYSIRAVSPKMKTDDSTASKTSATSPGDENATKTEPPRKKSSIYEQKQIEAPVASKGNRITARTEHLFKQYERDIAVHEAKPLASSDGGVNANETALTNGEKSKVDIAREEKQRELEEMKKSYQQRLEEEERAQAEMRKKQRQNEEMKYRRRSQDFLQMSEGQPPQVSRVEDDAKSDCSRRTSTSSSGDENVTKTNKGRKNSIYEQKQIEAPVTCKGNRITSKTENLFKQYDRDVGAPISVSSEDEKSKVDIAREEKQKELEEMKKLYQQRLEEEDRAQEEERIEQRNNNELKCSKALGDVKNRYLAIAQGESDQPDGEEEENDAALVDQNGEKIEKSGGKIEIVKSSDGVGSIRDRFGSIGKGGWKKPNLEGSDTDQVDSNAVNSARNLFKNFENQKQQDQKSTFNRPTSRKVRDPKELMESRKKATYGDEDELPEDGVVKKSVIIDEEELASGSSSRKEALNIYVQLETSPKDQSGNNGEIEKPKNRLLSDGEAKEEMMNKRSGSMSGSENDGGEEVSGYEGSDSPCSPTSTMSEDYVSDGQKDEKEQQSDDEYTDDEDAA